MPLTEDKLLESPELNNFIQQHRLPGSYRAFIKTYLLPFLIWLEQKKQHGATLVLGVNGAQGTGKSTVSEAIALLCNKQFGWSSAILSIDDIYLTRSERIKLSEQQHPLLLTRGVPGTHDTALGIDTIERLKSAAVNSEIKLPRFNKAIDDRLDQDQWTTSSGPVDLILFEGWCVGSTPQDGAELAEPANELEAVEDGDGGWRQYVNNQLSGQYQSLFSHIDLLLLLKAPDFEVVHGWRAEQEAKLAEITDGEHLMNEVQISHFIQHYERLTRHNLEQLPAIADVVFELDRNHEITGAIYKNRHSEA